MFKLLHTSVWLQYQISSEYIHKHVPIPPAALVCCLVRPCLLQCPRMWWTQCCPLWLCWETVWPHAKRRIRFLTVSMWLPSRTQRGWSGQSGSLFYSWTRKSGWIIDIQLSIWWKKPSLRTWSTLLTALMRLRICLPLLWMPVTCQLSLRLCLALPFQFPVVAQIWLLWLA